MNRLKHTILLSSLVFLVSCMQDQSRTELSSQQTADAIGCRNFKSKIFDSMYDYLDNEQEAPQVSKFTAPLSEKIDAIVFAKKLEDPEAGEKLKQNISELYKVLVDRTAKLKKPKDSLEHLQAIIEIEMGDISTPENIQLKQEAAAQFAKVEAAIKELDIACASETEAAAEETATAMTNPLKNVFIGSQNVLATAYQSCETLKVPALTAKTPPVQGIERYGTHPDGIGSKRRITSLSKVQSTHPYIKVAGNGAAGCFNVHSNPLIYDYGGSAAVANNIIDFSKNAGSGTSVLGVDCSAYVSAAIAAGGLRYKPGLENKAIYIRQNSSKFINAKQSGFSCFSNAAMTAKTSLRPGDIVAVKGHVVIIDKVGADPFGIKQIKSASKCKSLTTKNFDFTVSQSSPSLNGVGLNKAIAKEYVQESSKMAEAFLGIGKAACEAYFSGKSVATPSSSYGLIRHKETAECQSPKIQMAHQSCVNQCMQ